VNLSSPPFPPLAPAAPGSAPLLFALSGPSGSGKTELICRLVAHWRLASRRVAIIKHTHHTPRPDTPGKDTWRFREAGAALVGLASPGLLVLSQTFPDDPPLAAILRRLPPGIDLIVLEGYKSSPVPKLVLVPEGRLPEEFQEWPRVVGYVSDRQVPAPGPVFGRNQVADIAAFILSRAAPAW